MGTYFNEKLFIPSKLRDNELIQEYSSIVDNILADFSDGEKDILYKFRDPSQINIEAIKELIKEYGFPEIVDLLGSVPDETLRNLSGFIMLLALMKGTDLGVILISKLLGGDAEVLDWWMHGGTGVKYTYNLNWTVPSGSVDPAIFDKFRTFLRSYVYPLLTTWVISSPVAFGFDGTDPLVFGFSDYDEDKYWTLSTPIVLGEFYTPTTPNGLLYQCTTPGITHTVEPVWTTTVGDTTVDGTVIWTAVTADNTPGGCFSYVY